MVVGLGVVVSGSRVVLILNWAISKVSVADPATQKLIVVPTAKEERSAGVSAVQVELYAMTFMHCGAPGVVGVMGVVGVVSVLLQGTVVDL